LGEKLRFNETGTQEKNLMMTGEKAQGDGQDQRQLGVGSAAVLQTRRRWTRKDSRQERREERRRDRGAA